MMITPEVILLPAEAVYLPEEALAQSAIHAPAEAPGHGAGGTLQKTMAL